MEESKKTISDLLNVRVPMEIPKYQRDFVWSDVEGREFFDDLTDSEIENPLFLGTFIFNEERKGDSREVVDGQQRITTILILLIACRVFSKESEFNDTVQNIQSHITTQARGPGSPPCCLSTQGRIGKSLEVMSKPDWGGNYTTEMGNRYGWNRIRKAYEFFRDELRNKSYDKEKIWELIEKLLSVEYIDITVRDNMEAITIFERVNARGQHLAVYDLIKSFLFAQSFDNPELKDIEEEWNEIKKYAENSDNKLKRMLYFFQFSREGYIAPVKLYRKLKNLAEANTRTFVDDLKKFAKFFSILSLSKNEETDFKDEMKKYLYGDMNLKGTKMDDEDNIGRVINSLFSIRLFKVVSVYPLIYSSLLSLSRNIAGVRGNTNKERKYVQEWISLLDFFEKFSFVTTKVAHVAPLYGGKLQKLYSEYCEKFSKKESDFIETVQHLKGDFSEIKVSEEEFVERFLNEISYGKSKEEKGIIHYIFHKINTTVEGQNIEPSNVEGAFSAENYKTMGNNIEHILAQKNGDTEDEINKINAIGNLLIIHRKLNSRLGSEAPEKRVEKLQEEFNAGHIMNKPYIEDLLEYFNQECIQKGREWDENLIEERSKKIAKQIYKMMNYTNMK